MKKIKEGTILIAINECIMNESSFENAGKPALIIGKEYVVKEVTRNQILIESELDENHFFEIKSIDEFFTAK
jgi:hypothetical protein